MRLPSVLAWVALAIGAFACSGGGGRKPTLPPPVYERPEVMAWDAGKPVDPLGDDDAGWTDDDDDDDDEEPPAADAAGQDTASPDGGAGASSDGGAEASANSKADAAAQPK